MHLNKHRLVIGIFLGVIFFIVGVWTLPHYGITWDTPNHLLRGQAYLHYYLTGRKDYADLPPETVYFQNSDTLSLSTNIPNNKFLRRSIYQSYEFKSLTHFLEQGHPPLSDIFSSLSNFIFFQKLGWVNDIDAYRLYGIFLASTLVLVVFYWGAEVYGILAGLIASLALIFYPLFLGESHFNTEKDIPETVFIGLLLFCFWKGIIKKNWRWLIVSSIFFGMALGTKFNVVFTSLTILVWLIVYFWPKIKTFCWPFNRRLTLALIFYPLIGIVIFFLSRPLSWQKPLWILEDTFQYYGELAINFNFDPRFLTLFKINTYALQWILFTTPLIILGLFFSGLVYVLKNGFKEKRKTSLLFLAWFMVPIVRVTLPNMGIYGGVRQIMEYIPAMALLAGVGASWLQKKLTKKFGLNRLLVSSLLILTFLPISLKMISIHPNENVYFNPLIDGLNGAKKRNLPSAGNTFGNAYRQGIKWVNLNAPPGAKLVYIYEMMSNIPYIWVRNDINFTNLNRSGFLKQGEYVINSPYEDYTYQSYYGRYLERMVVPVFQIMFDNTPILKIWKNDLEHTKSEYLEEKIIVQPKIDIGRDTVIFDMEKRIKLSRLELQISETNCAALQFGTFYLSDDGQTWEKLPESLPEGWPVTVLRDQPAGGKLIYPFAAEEARFIKIKVVPDDACVKKILKTKIWEFPK